MPLPTNYVGQGGSWPWLISSPGRSGIPTTNKQPLNAVPALLMKRVFTAPATIVTNGFSAAHAGPNTATVNMTLGGSLAGVNDFARNVVITVTHASAVVAETGTITGTDEYGKVITEDWSVTAGTTSKTFTGKKAFKTVTQISETAAADASANTTIAGNGKVLGLPFKAASIVPIGEMQDGALPTAGVIVIGSSVATADYRGTYTPNAALNGAIVFTVYFLVDDPTDIGT